MFFPLTGTPIVWIERMRMRLADWLPVPFEVATVMVTSLTRERFDAPPTGVRVGSMPAWLM